MEKIKFRYTVERANGFIFSRIFTLQEIEAGCVETFFEANNIGFGDKVYREQYTGLKDKNGKEIYEGDIVRHLVTSTPKDMYEDECVIYDAASFKYETNDGTRSFLEWPASVCLEVIGNIHEEK